MARALARQLEVRDAVAHRLLHERETLHDHEPVAVERGDLARIGDRLPRRDVLELARARRSDDGDRERIGDVHHQVREVVRAQQLAAKGQRPAARQRAQELGADHSIPRGVAVEVVLHHRAGVERVRHGERQSLGGEHGAAADRRPARHRHGVLVVLDRDAEVPDVALVQVLRVDAGVTAGEVARDVQAHLPALIRGEPGVAHAVVLSPVAAEVVAPVGG